MLRPSSFGFQTLSLELRPSFFGFQGSCLGLQALGLGLENLCINFCASIFCFGPSGYKPWALGIKFCTFEFWPSRFRLQAWAFGFKLRASSLGL
ncbi:hypothetical protein AXF42_Ash009230 [Apostasia shenzhenica]|uniref:Uncharacterized protein n=1 Tax=Apostasia shenzhenica TaxID=1088818 RepID=A0A2I0B3I0_9ASPA|nr:hypothetical protein AXF42_Ash009230 [Apostasia shenzhenica]